MGQQEILNALNYNRAMTVPEIVKKLKEDPIWEIFLTEKEGVIEPFPYDYSSWDQPDTRWILGYAWIAEKLNSNEFTANEMIDLVSHFYNFFYELEASFISDEILPMISIFL